jgi:hypothetical protein
MVYNPTRRLDPLEAVADRLESGSFVSPERD